MKNKIWHGSYTPWLEKDREEDITFFYDKWEDCFEEGYLWYYSCDISSLNITVPKEISEDVMDDVIESSLAIDYVTARAVLLDPYSSPMCDDPDGDQKIMVQKYQALLAVSRGSDGVILKDEVGTVYALAANNIVLKKASNESIKEMKDQLGIAYYEE